VHDPCEDKNNDVNDSFYEELGCVFDQLPRYYIKILLGDFNANVGRKDIFKLRVHMKLVMVMELRVVNFTTSKNLAVESTTFPHRDIHKHTWTSPEGKTHNHTNHFLLNRRQHSSILDAQSLGGVDCDTDHYLVVAEARERCSEQMIC
jgi:hypothetical protein